MNVRCPWCRRLLRRDPLLSEPKSEICDKCKVNLLAAVPVVQTCPHGEPVSRYCVGCEATTGGNDGA